MPDILSEVLDTLELESSIYFRAQLSRPYSIAVPEHPNVVRFHIASEGRCVLSLEGVDPVAFGPGDLVMVPRGSGHVLSDDAEQAARPLSEVLDSSGFDGDGPLVYGGGGERTVLVCGHFGFSPRVTHPFLETLPPVLHLRRDEGPDYSWVERMLAFTEHESRTRPTGWQGVVERLSQVLFVYVLRAHLEQGEGDLGALAALSDPQLAAAMTCIHDSPATDWTLDTLAQKAGLSRSAFVRRFSSVCGVAPMKYLARWRMAWSRHLLARSSLTVGEIAARVGYASEAAFGRAFRDHFQEPPGAFRRARREAESAIAEPSPFSRPPLEAAVDPRARP